MMWSLGEIAENDLFFYQAPNFRRNGVRHLMIASLLIAVVRFAMIGYLAQSLLAVDRAVVACRDLRHASFGFGGNAAEMVFRTLAGARPSLVHQYFIWLGRLVRRFGAGLDLG